MVKVNFLTAVHFWNQAEQSHGIFHLSDTSEILLS